MGGGKVGVAGYQEGTNQKQHEEQEVIQICWCVWGEGGKLFS